MIKTPCLDIDLLRSFVTVAEADSFTSAGALLGASQSAMSVRIRKLEERLGRRLLDRSPRSLALTAFGESFLADARRVLQAHDDAVLRIREHQPRPVFRLAVSDHAAGACLPEVLALLAGRHTETQFTVTVGVSAELMEGFAAGRFDAVVARDEGGGATGRSLFRDRLIWASAKDFHWDPAEPLPLISLAAPCGVRATAITALDVHEIPWREVFVGTGVAAVQAAVSAGLGVAALDRRNLPADGRAIGAGAGLPALPPSQMRLYHSKVRGEREIVAAIVAAFRDSGGPA